MICLGIESTAHTFGVGIVSKKNVLVNVRDSYTTTQGGIIPTEAAQHHKDVQERLIKEALDEFTRTNKGAIDLVAYSRGPGMGPCLHVGANVAEALAKKLGVPFLGVNHALSHLSVGSLVTPVKDPVFLYVSGANTQVICYEGKRYRVFGETLDQGLGNVLDTFARYAGLGFPGGPKIDALAQQGKEYVALPYAVKGMDVSFSGLLTNLKQKYDKKQYKIEDLAYSLQETAFAMLLEVAERAMAHCKKEELLLGGGVCCNTRLKVMAQTMCQERDAKCYIPSNAYLTDNGGMIAYTGILAYEGGNRENKTELKPYERIDEIPITWKD